MSDQQNVLFDPVALTPGEIVVRGEGNRAGRPKGAKGKRMSLGWRMCEIATPDILRQIITRALRCEDDGDIRCAEIVLNRTMPRPKTPPVQLDVTQNIDARTLLGLVAQGQMSPTDAASLWNSLSRNGHGASAVAELAPGSADVREQVAGKLAGIVAARLAQSSGVSSE